MTAKPFAVTVGGLYSPSGAESGDGSFDSGATVQIEPVFGVRYDVGKTRGSHPTTYGLYVDYVGSRARTVAFGFDSYDGFGPGSLKTKASGFGAGLEVRQSFGRADRELAPYIGGGLGVYREHTRVDETATFNLGFFPVKEPTRSPAPSIKRRWAERSCWARKRDRDSWQN